MPRQTYYIGLIDDYGIRNRLTPYAVAEEPQPDLLRREFLRSLYLDEELLINDGYLANSYPARVMVTHPNDWPLRSFATKGLARILTRTGGDLGTLVDAMATDGIESFRGLRVGAGYAGLKESLQSLGEDLRAQGQGLCSWPKYDTDAAFQRTIEVGFKEAIGRGLYVIADEKFRAVFDAFMSCNRKRRNEWESVVKASDQELNDIEVHELLRFGNEAYHYNWGAMLTAASHASNGTPLRVLTSATEAFQFLREKAINSEPLLREIDPVVLHLPDIESVPQDNSGRWDRLVDIFLTDPHIRRLRTEFLAAMDAYFLAPSPSTQKNAQALAGAYSLAVKVAYAKPVIDKTFTLSMFVLGMATSFVPGAQGFLLNAIISVASMKQGSEYPHLVSVLRKIVPAGVRMAVEEKPAHMLAFDAEAVTGHLAGVKRFA